MSSATRNTAPTTSATGLAKMAAAAGRTARRGCRYASSTMAAIMSAIANRNGSCPLARYTARTRTSDTAGQ